MRKVILLIFIGLGFFNAYTQTDCVNQTHEKIEINCTQSREGNYLIKNKTEFDELLRERSNHPDCVTYTLPYVNFEKYSIIGIEKNIGSEEAPEINLEICKNNLTQIVKINFTYKRIFLQGFYLLYRLHEWYLIPKVDDNYVVEFNIIDTTPSQLKIGDKNN